MASSLTLGEGEASSTMVSFTLEGQWTVTPSGDDPGGRSVFAAAIEEPRLALEGAPEEERARLSKALTMPIFFVEGEDGAVVETRVPPSMPGFAQSVLKAIAGHAQFVGDGRGSWETREVDATGRFAAKYETLEAGVRYEKRKTGYEAVGRDKSEGSTAEIERSRSMYAFARPGHLERLDAEETIAVSSGVSLPTSKSATELSLRLRKTEENGAALAELGRLFGTYAAGDLGSGTTQEAAALELDEAMISGMTFDSALAALRELGEAVDDESRRKKDRVFVGLEAILRRDGAAVDQAVSLIKGGDERSGMLLDALGFSSGTAAQDALSRLALEGGDTKLRFEALRSLSYSREPGAVNAETNASLFDDPALGRQARYGLGTAISRMAEQGRTDGLEGYLQMLLDGLAAAATREETVVALRAIGNAGLVQALEAVRPFFGSEDAVLRGEAANAVRKMPGAEVDGLLGSLLLGDADMSVRAQAVAAIETRPASHGLLTAMDAAARKDAAPYIRSRVLALLVRGTYPMDAVRPTLAWVAEHDSDPKIKEKAQAALAA